MAKQTTDTKATPLTEEQLFAKEAELKTQSENLAKERADFEAEKAEFEAGKSEAPKAEEVQEPVSFDYEGEDWIFTNEAPRTILWAGSPVTQEEIAKDEDLKLQLIGGKSNLIIKKQ